MNLNPCHSVVCFLLLLTAVTARADYSGKFLETAGSQAVLFSGNGHARYPFHFEESPYLFGEVFPVGEVVCNSIRYTNVRLNYDVLQDLLYVRTDSLSLPVRLDPESATSFVLNGCHFIQTSSVPDIDGKMLTGYARILFQKEGCMLLKKITMKPYETPEGKFMAHHLDRVATHFLLLNGKLYKVKGKGTFRQLFPRQKKKMRAVSRHFSAQKDPDSCYVQLLQAVIVP